MKKIKYAVIFTAHIFCTALFAFGKDKSLILPSELEKTGASTFISTSEEAGLLVLSVSQATQSESFNNIVNSLNESALGVTELQEDMYRIENTINQQSLTWGTDDIIWDLNLDDSILKSGKLAEGFSLSVPKLKLKSLSKVDSLDNPSEILTSLDSDIDSYADMNLVKIAKAHGISAQDCVLKHVILKIKLNSDADLSVKMSSPEYFESLKLDGNVVFELGCGLSICSEDNIGAKIIVEVSLVYDGKCTLNEEQIAALSTMIDTSAEMLSQEEFDQLKIPLSLHTKMSYYNDKNKCLFTEEKDSSAYEIYSTVRTIYDTFLAAGIMYS